MYVNNVTDSCSTATLVFSMCRMVMDALKSGNEVVKTDVARVASWGQEDWSPKTPQELCNRLLVTVYMVSLPRGMNTKLRLMLIVPPR